MQCPECGSEHIRKNGHRRGKQNHLCIDCQGVVDWTAQSVLTVIQFGKAHPVRIERLCVSPDLQITGMSSM